MMHDYSTLPLFSLQPETREIPLTQGKVAIVDAADYEWLMQWKWYAYKDKSTFYARRTQGTKGVNQKTISMHRVILEAEPGTIVDHRDGDGLNNSRKNLRLTDLTGNARNRKVSVNRSGFKGVIWHKGNRKWCARINANGKRKFLGQYASAIDAAKAYDEAAREIHGEFAVTNFMKGEGKGDGS